MTEELIKAKAGRDRKAIANFSHALDIDDKAVAAFREAVLFTKSSRMSPPPSLTSLGSRDSTARSGGLTRD